MEQEIIIERMAYGGEGIGRIDGRVCFVENALPGETVRAEILQYKKKFIRARTIQVLKASPHRVEPPCPYVTECGGCQYQHVSYEEELRWKDIQARDHLTRQLKIEPERVLPIVPSSSPYGTRNSVTLHPAPARRPGFFSRDNISIIPVAQCLLVDPRLEKAFAGPLGAGEESVTFRLDHEGTMHTSREAGLLAVGVNSTLIQTPARGFFQNNLVITGRIAETLKNWAEEKSPRVFLDLFAGSGTFALLAAPQGARLVLMEDYRQSITALRANLAEKKIEADIHEGRVENSLPRLMEKGGLEKSFAFFDPPRQGMAPSLAALIGSEAPFETIAYLSCHMGTLTRDLGLILQTGRYRIEKAVPFDMFPRTKHIEILTLLEKIG